jgi:hypothetical protein
LESGQQDLCNTRHVDMPLMMEMIEEELARLTDFVILGVAAGANVARGHQVVGRRRACACPRVAGKAGDVHLKMGFMREPRFRRGYGFEQRRRDTERRQKDQPL